MPRVWRRWSALGAVSLVVLAITLDGTVLSVALPTLAKALHASEAELEWFSAGYLLMLAAAVLPAGLVGDRYGRKTVMLVSLTAFGVGSVLCAYAPSPAVFLVARLAMGMAGAGVTVMALSTVSILFDEGERPLAVGVYEAANFLALPLGPILAGWMMSRFWWGWVFLINVPVVVVGLAIGLALLPRSRAERLPSVDRIGSVTSAGGLVAVTYGLILAGQRGFGDTVALALIVLGGAILATFLAWEGRLLRKGGEPLVDPSLFRSRLFTWGAAAAGIAGLGMIGLLFLMPQYFQAVQGANTLTSGLRLLPLAAGLIVGALPASAIAKRVGSRGAVAIGFVLQALGAAVGTCTSVTSPTWFVSAWMLVLCAGTGLALTAGTAAAIGRLSAERSGIGSAVVQAIQKTAGPVGTAVMGSVASAAYESGLGRLGLPHSLTAAAEQSVYNGVAIADRLGQAGLRQMVLVSFVHGLDASLLLSTLLAMIGIGLSLTFLPRSSET